MIKAMRLWLLLKNKSSHSIAEIALYEKYSVASRMLPNVTRK